MRKNIILSLEGEKAGFIEHEFSTFKEVFDEVKLFDVSTLPKNEVRNLILVGFNYKGQNTSYSEEYGDMLKNEVMGFTSDKKAFTDDFAPVEKYTN